MTTYYGLKTVLNPDYPVVSHSDLSSFKRDRLLWFVTTYLGIRTKHGEPPVSPLVLGAMAHSALELRYREHLDMDMAFAIACTEHAKRFAHYPYFPVHEWEKQAELCRTVLEGYEQWRVDENIDHDIETVGVERFLDVPISVSGHTVHLIGKADHIVRNRVTKEILVYDWKTTSNLERTTRQARTNEQLPYYMILEQASIDPHDRVGGAAYTMLLKSKRTARSSPPYYRREVVRYGPPDLANRRVSIGGALHDYLDVLFRLHDGISDPLRLCYPNPSMFSFTNDFEQLIDVLITGGRIKDMVTQDYTQIDPYARYRTEPASMM